MENEPTELPVLKTFANLSSMAEELMEKLSSGGTNLPIFPNSPQDIQNCLLEAELPNIFFPAKNIGDLMEEIQGKNSNEHSTLLFLFLMKCFSSMCHQNSLTYDLIREGIYKGEEQNAQLKLLLEKLVENLKSVQNEIQSLITVKGGNAIFAQKPPSFNNSSEKFQNSAVRNPAFARDPKNQIEVQLEVPGMESAQVPNMESSRKTPVETSRKTSVFDIPAPPKSIYLGPHALGHMGGAGSGSGSEVKKFSKNENPDLTMADPMTPVWSGYGRSGYSDPRILRSETDPSPKKLGNVFSDPRSILEPNLTTKDPELPSNLEEGKQLFPPNFAGSPSNFSANLEGSLGPSFSKPGPTWASISKTHLPTFSKPPSKTLFPFQITLNNHFGSTEKAKFEFLQPYQIQNKLPKIKIVGACSDQKGGISTQKFVLYFQLNWERAMWIQKALKDIDNFDAVAMSSLRHPKILVEGVPAELAFKSPYEIVKVLSAGFGLRTKAFKYLFQIPVDRTNPEYFCIILAVHPDARRHIYSMGDQCLFPNLKFSVQVKDFVKPLQCNKCTAFDHSAKHCPYMIKCKQCCSPTCAIDSEDCPNKGCVNCGSKSHTGLQRGKCEVYRNLMQKTFDTLTEILKTNCPSDSPVLLHSSTDLSTLFSSDSEESIFILPNKAKINKINSEETTNMEDQLESSDGFSEHKENEMNTELTKESDSIVVDLTDSPVQNESSNLGSKNEVPIDNFNEL
jgi:hypothetical protein